MRESLKLAALKAGLTTERIAEKLQALADAQRFELSRNGDPVHLGPDNRAQLQAMDIVIKMLGGYPNPRLEVNTGTQNVLVIDSARHPLAAMDPFSVSVEAPVAAVEAELPAMPEPAWNPSSGVAQEDDFLVG